MSDTSRAWDSRSRRWYYIDAQGVRRECPQPASRPTEPNASPAHPANVQTGRFMPQTGIHSAPTQYTGTHATTQRASYNGPLNTSFSREAQTAQPQYSYQSLQGTLTYPNPEKAPPLQHAANPALTGITSTGNGQLAQAAGSLRRLSLGPYPGSAQHPASFAAHGNSNGGPDRRASLDPSISSTFNRGLRFILMIPDYKVRPPSFFVQGRVLLTLWTEPEGQSRQPTTVLSHNKDVFYVAHGERAFSKVRRFIVMATSDQHCTAISISTHGGRAAQFTGYGQSQHGVVYTRAPPQPTPGTEPNLQPIAVRINPDERDQDLVGTSRIHYGKLYTIEYNLKVKSFGMVDRGSLEALTSQFRLVIGKQLGFTQMNASSQAQTIQPMVNVAPGVSNSTPLRSPKPVETRRLLSTQQQHGLARHAAVPRTKNSSSNASQGKNASSPPGQHAALRRDSGTTAGLSHFPLAPFAEQLTTRGFNQSQINDIRKLMRRKVSPQAAIARTQAIKEGYSPRFANVIMGKVKDGADYVTAVRQIRAIVEAQQQGARNNTGAGAAANEDSDENEGEQQEDEDEDEEESNEDEAIEEPDNGEEEYEEDGEDDEDDDGTDNREE